MEPGVVPGALGGPVLTFGRLNRIRAFVQKVGSSAVKSLKVWGLPNR